MSIADALFSDSQARLFPWLFGQPARSFHLSELRRLTGSASPVIHRPAVPNEDRRCSLDPSRAAKSTGWRAKVRLADGLRQTYEAALK